MATLNEIVARASRNHQVVCEESVGRTWSVYCLAGCIEKDPDHPNFGHGWCKAAPGGEEQAARIALDHLSKLGFVPQRLASLIPAQSGFPMGEVLKPRNTYE